MRCEARTALFRLVTCSLAKGQKLALNVTRCIQQNVICTGSRYVYATHHFLSTPHVIGELLIHTCRKLRTGWLIHILNYVWRCLTFDTCSMLNSPNTGLSRALELLMKSPFVCRARGWWSFRVHIPRVPGHRQNLPHYTPHTTQQSLFRIRRIVQCCPFFDLLFDCQNSESVLGNLGCCREQVLGYSAGPSKVLAWTGNTEQ